MFAKRLITLGTALLFLGACMNPALTPRDRGAALGLEGYNLYFALKAKYEEKLNSPDLTEDQKVELSRKVVPLLNQLKEVTKLHLKLVVLWDTQGIKPGELDSVEQELETLITKIYALMGGSR